MYSVGIDLGGTFSKVALVSPLGEIIEFRKLPTVAGREPQEALLHLRNAVEEMRSRHGLGWPPPRGAGLAVPAVIDHRTAWLSLSGPLGWRDLPLGELARKAFGCDVAVDDDVAAGALADLYFGCARTAFNLLYVSWGTGIGAGLILGRRLYRSRGGAMYEFGHVPADPESQRLCYCGCRGCLEVEAGGKAIADQVRQRLSAGEPSLLAGAGEITVERVAWAAERNDRAARWVLERAAVLLARALAGALALLNPDMVVFGGGVSLCFPLIQETFDRELRLRTPVFSIEKTVITHSKFGDRAGVLGAALLPVERGEH